MGKFFVVSVLGGAGLFIGGLMWLGWAENREARKWVEISAQLRAQRRRDRLQGGQLDRLNQAMIATSQRAAGRRPGIFPRRWALLAGSGIAIVMLVRSMTASSNPPALSPAPASRPAPAAAVTTPDFLAPQNDQVTSRSAFCLEKEKVIFDYDHSRVWTAHGRQNAGVTRSSSSAKNAVFLTK